MTACTSTDPIWHLPCELPQGHDGDHDNAKAEWSQPMNGLDALTRAIRHNEAVDAARDGIR